MQDERDDEGGGSQEVTPRPGEAARVPVDCGHRNISPADEVAGAEAHEARWRPGLVEVLFHDSVAALVIPRPDRKGNELISRTRFELSDVYEISNRHGWLGTEPAFVASPDEAARARSIALQQGMELPDLNSIVILRFPDEADVERIAQELSEAPGVEHAAPLPQVFSPSSLPNDSLLGHDDQDSADPQTGLKRQWYIFRCRADRAWGLATGANVVIADIDSGFLVTHVDLKDNIELHNAYNSADGSPKVSQGAAVGALRHGTGVLGIAGAGSDGFGMVGFAYNAGLWPIQAAFSSSVQSPPFDPWARAIDWVRTADSGGRRKVILLESQTGKDGNLESVKAVSIAVGYAIAWGAVVCVTAGNGDRDAGLDDDDKCFPPTGSILVGATKFCPTENKRWHRSNWGPSVVVSAPGDGGSDVTCCSDSDVSYRSGFGGTSGAAAKVAGTAALMLEANPLIRHSDLRDILKQTGTSVVTDASKPVGTFLDSEAAVRRAKCAPKWGTSWQQLPGSALDIWVGADGLVWHVGDDGHLYRGDGETWERDETLGFTGDAARIAVGPDGTPWYISDAAGAIYRRDDGNWRQVPGQALDIATGADGSVWHVGVDNIMYRWDGGDWQQDAIPGFARRIAVGPDGTPWHISNSAPDIYRRIGNHWQQVPGQALDISIGADGSVWCVGLNETGEGHAMYRWGGSDWEPIDGAAVGIAVAADGLPWHINRLREIFKRV